MMKKREEKIIKNQGLEEDLSPEVDHLKENIAITVEDKAVNPILKNILQKVDVGINHLYLSLKVLQNLTETSIANYYILQELYA